MLRQGLLAPAEIADRFSMPKIKAKLDTKRPSAA